ncbi:MAG: PDZ domain-containing protein [Deltaproteobacteria bacterium]|nr:PDZ domain-containing protein [Deltaproteobacteria bacterium]
MSQLQEGLPGIFRQPDVSESHIVFVYASDIWRVEKQGGPAQRLTSVQGTESFPRFSPGGESLAFSADYTGNRDLYTLSTAGGVPQRKTFHPASDLLIDWHPEGRKLLFASRRQIHNSFYSHFFEIPIEGGPATRIKIPFAADGAYSRSSKLPGRFIAFQMLGRDVTLWRGYQGGLASGLFVFDTLTHRVVRLAYPNRTYAAPMWRDGDLYFISDRTDQPLKEGKRNRKRIFNLWVFRGLETQLEKELEEKQIESPERLTQENEDLNFPAMGPSDMVFTQGGEVFRIPFGDGTPDFGNPLRVPIELTPDRSALVPEWRPVDNLIQSFDLSSDGSRLLVSARGSIFDLPVAGGPTRLLDRFGPGSVRLESAERSAVWLDEEHILFHSDARPTQKDPSVAQASSGRSKPSEYDLVLHQIASGNEKVFHFKEGFRYRLTVSPCCHRAVFVDQTSSLQLVELDTHDRLVTREIGKLEGMLPYQLQRMRPCWSPTGHIVVFHDYAPNGNRRLNAVVVDSAERRILTSGFTSDCKPSFAPEGTYLYFVSRRGLHLTESELGGGAAAYSNTDRLARVQVNLAATSGSRDGSDLQGTPILDSVFGPLASFEEQIEVVPLPSRRLHRINAVAEDQIVIQDETPTGDRTLSLVKAASPEPLVLLGSPGDYSISGDGSVLVVMESNRLWRFDLELAKQGAVSRSRIDSGGLAKVIDRREEWHQLFRESWRLVRDFFHDEKRLRKIRWPSLYQKYEKRVQAVATRDELNQLLSELYAEVGSSHTRLSGGDIDQVDPVRVGLLGADLVYDATCGDYRLENFSRPGRWLPEVAAPLIRAGVGEGSYLLAVDGVSLTRNREPWEVFQGKAGRQVHLLIRDPGGCDGQLREVEVVTLDMFEETTLRQLAWIEGNRAVVEAASAGVGRRLGYVYIPNTERRRGAGLWQGRHLFERQFRDQIDRDGLIFDTRFNGGGPLPYDIIDEIRRQPLDTLADRRGPLGSWPVPNSTPHRVLLINGWSGSAGELLADFFKRADLGRLLGSRTFGGVNYYLGGPRLIDGGASSLANVVHLDPLSGETNRIEGKGVKPDLDVPEDLNQLAAGVDNQLQGAIEYLLSRLKR